MRRTALLLSLSAVVFLSADRTAQAQFAVGGVYVDAEGMLRETAALAPDERLKRLRAGAAEILAANADVQQPSALRKISLRRLEQAAARLAGTEQPLPADMRFLAGLTQIRYVLFYPQDGDVVLAGPAEDWQAAESGEVVGRQTNRPVLQLDDLVVALRAAHEERPTPPFIGCSIDPTPEGFQRYTAYMRQLGGRMDRTRAKEIFTGMEQALGPQAVRVFGVPASSRFALKLVAADYRLKRIALGHDPSPVREVVNYLDLAARRLTNPGAPQPQHRWWFLAGYDAVLHTPDRTAYEFQGHGVRVSTAPQAMSGNARPVQATPAARQFAESFTRHFPEMARRVPVFAELQNLIALSVAAELIAQNSAAEGAAESAWRPAHFLDDHKCPIAESAVPQFVPSMANFRIVGDRHWLISISGGVEIPARSLVSREVLREATDAELPAARRDARLPEDAARWWWD